ncbi:unnamed protein product [Alternaria alternata]
MPSFDSSKLAESATGNFLDLPKGIRNNIYEKVLAVPHPIYLFQEPNSRVETFAPEKPSRGWAETQVYGDLKGQSHKQRGPSRSARRKHLKNGWTRKDRIEWQGDIHPRDQPRKSRRTTDGHGSHVEEFSTAVSTERTISPHAPVRSPDQLQRQVRKEREEPSPMSSPSRRSANQHSAREGPERVIERWRAQASPTTQEYSPSRFRTPNHSSTTTQHNPQITSNPEESQENQASSSPQSESPGAHVSAGKVGKASRQVRTSQQRQRRAKQTEQPRDRDKKENQSDPNERSNAEKKAQRKAAAKRAGTTKKTRRRKSAAAKRSHTQHHVYAAK